ncbi:MAG TPA: helix-hairpin-helix domain-containing protein [Vicinamibacterales bacterium]|jgi:competence protein ComEA|nr:helix-hairpin-helix domain-containing protein [Vicinamibacterales bacterium]
MRQVLSNAAALAVVLLVSTGLLADLHAQASKPKGDLSAVAAAPATKPAMMVNINTATAAQLEALPGVGAKTAARIIDYRQKKGTFKKVEELMNVQGIGEKSFLKLKPQVTIGGNAP